MTQKRLIVHRHILLLVGFLVLMALLLQPVQAQEDSTRSVHYGETVGAFFDNGNVPQAWEFAGHEREIVEVAVRRIGGRFSPRVEVISPSGNVLIPTEQTADAHEQSLIFRDGLPEDGLYQLVVHNENALPMSDFLANEYSLTLERLGVGRATTDEGVRPLPEVGLSALPDLFTGQSFLAAPINMTIYGTVTLNQPDPTQRSHLTLENTVTVQLNNANPLSREINAFAFARGGFAFRTEDGSVFFTNQDVAQLEFVSGIATIRLANNQLIVTDFYRVAELLAVDDLIVARMIDGQRIVLEGETLDMRRRGGLNGEGPNAEPVNVITLDGTAIETDLTGWQTLAVLRDGTGRYVRVEYGRDMRFIADTMNINLFGDGNSARRDLDPVGLDPRLIEITYKRQDNPLPLIIDPTGMGDVMLARGDLRVAPLDGRTTSAAVDTVRRLLIENLAIRYENFDNTYFVSLPDGTEILTPATIPADPLALPNQPGYQPQYYNNLGTHIFDYHPNINFTRALQPVSLVNGNFFYAVTDFAVPSNTLELNWTRYYNSLAPQSQTPDYIRQSPEPYLFGQFGYGWRHSYQVELDVRYAPLGQVRVILPDGGIYLFNAINADLTRFRSEHLLSWTVVRVDGVTGAWRAFTTEGMTYDFDRAGRLKRITDANGLSLLFSPIPRENAADFQTTTGFVVTDTYGRHIEIFTNEAGQIVGTRDAQGREIHYTYERDLLIGATYPGMNQTATYGYLHNALTEIADTHSPYHQQMRIAYNNANQVTEYTFNPDGDKSLVTQVSYAVEGSNHVVTETSTVNGSPITNRWLSDDLFRLIEWQMPKTDWIVQWKYDLESERLSEYVMPNRASLRFSFDDAGYLTQFRDPVFASNPYSFTYTDTPSGMRLLKRIDYPPVGVSLVADTFVYDEFNRLASVIRPVQTTPRRVEQVTNYAYDELGRLIRTARVLNADATIDSVYAYDDFGYIAEIREGNNSRLTQLQHDVNGRLRSVVDGRGTRYAIAWDDERDLITGLQVSSEADTQTLTFAYAYDEIGNLTAYTYQGATDSYTYDSLNHLSISADALGHETTYEFDEVGNLLSVVPLGDAERAVYHTYDELNFLSTSTTPSGLITQYHVALNTENNRTSYQMIASTGEQYDFVYDAIGRLRQVTVLASPTSVTPGTRIFDYQLAYNPLGYLTEITEAHTSEARTLTVAYDLLGNVTASSIATATTRYSYDVLGRLLTVTDPEDRITSYTYDALDNIIQATTPDGSQRQFAYDANSNLITYTNALGQDYQYSYDGLNRLIAMRDPENNRTTYTYDVRGNLVSLTDPLENTATAEYDMVDNLTRLTDAVGNETRFNYNDLNQLIRITEGGGLLTTDIVYDSDGFISALTQPGNREVLYGRDSLGRIITETNSLGYTTSYTYNTIGSIGRIVNPLGNEQRYNYTSAARILGFSDTNGANYTYTADAIGRLTSLNDTSRGQSRAVNARIAYDDSGYITQIRFGPTATIAGSQAAVHAYSYDANGRLISYKPPESTAAWLFTYDAEGQLETVTDPEGQLVRYSYDSAGNVIRIIRSSTNLTEPERTETFVYNASGQVTEYVAPDGLHSQFFYDADGRLTQRIDNGERTTFFEYDELGRLSRYVDASGYETLYRYDEFGNIIGIERSLVTDEATVPYAYRFEYDTVNNLIRVQLPGGQQINQTYDVLSQRVRYIGASGNGWSYSYDAGHNLTQISDPLGNSLDYEYDLSNRLIALASANRSPTTFAYDANGNLAEVRLPENFSGEQEQIDYTLDRNGNLVRIQHGVSANDSVEYERDNLGRITSITHITRDNPNGNTVPVETRYSYNSQGQITEISTPNGRITRAYDAAGRLLQVTGVEGTTTYDYDAFGQLVRMRGGSVDTTYKYDAAGHLIERQIDGIGLVAYTYDMLYRPIRVIINGIGINITYDANGRRASIVRDNGLETRYTYDASGRIRNMLHTNAAGDRLDFFVYEYDAVGNIVRITRGDNTTVLYSYDARQQLISERWLDSENQPLYAVSYRYDDAGNREERVTRIGQQNAERTEFAYNEHNQLEVELRNAPFAIEQRLMLPVVVGMVGLVPMLWKFRRKRRYLPLAIVVLPLSIPFFQIGSSQSEIRYSYDTTGSLLSVEDDLGHRLQYDYDAFNRLTVIFGIDFDNHPVDVSWRYDAMGRVAEIETLRPAEMSADGAINYEEVTYQFLYDAFGLVAIRNLNDDTSTNYFSVFPDEVLLIVDGETVLWPLHDALGTLRRFANADGDLADESSMDVGAFGELLQPFGVDAAYRVNQPMPLWIGQVYEPNSATYTFGVRSYDPRLGHFLQRDPVRHDPYANLYTYAYNRPTVYTDTTGLTPNSGFAGLSPDIADTETLLNFQSPLLQQSPIITRVSDVQAAENQRILQVAHTARYQVNIFTGLLDPTNCTFYVHEVNSIPSAVRQVLADESDTMIEQFNTQYGWQPPSLPDPYQNMNPFMPLQDAITATRLLAPQPFQDCSLPIALPSVLNPQAGLADEMQRTGFLALLTEAPFYTAAEAEVEALLQAGQFPQVDLPTVEVTPIEISVIPRLPGQIGEMLESTRAFYTDILLPPTFGLSYEWRSLSQVYDVAPPAIRRVH